jgi:hypothetical protein
MPSVQLGKVAVEEAEIVVARIFRIVEANHLPSPRLLTRRAERDSLIEIELSFDRREDCDLVRSWIEASVWRGSLELGRRWALRPQSSRSARSPASSEPLHGKQPSHSDTPIRPAANQYAKTVFRDTMFLLAILILSAFATYEFDVSVLLNYSREPVRELTIELDEAFVLLGLLFTGIFGVGFHYFSLRRRDSANT